ncbi:MAG: hypothetical protein QOE03_2524, partial [Micromonosporaceae bacterium]|nr:hypothetical protein [Micromonosporaceae bacterium]
DAYGLDSLGAIQLVRNLEADFGRLPKVLLYECTTIAELAADLLRRDESACRAVAGRFAPATPPITPPPVPPAARAARAPSVAGPVTADDFAGRTADAFAGRSVDVSEPPASAGPIARIVEQPVAMASPTGPEPVAIIGLAANLPGSPDLPALWRNLRDGVDLVTEIPGERFDWRRVYGDPSREPGKTNSRWGAFIDGVTHFDAGFFGISPLEADLMDPQQRLFLQMAWRAIEDAGYRPGDLAGTRTGVYVGATSHDYDAYLTEVGRDREAHSSSGLAHCIIANRVSFQLDLRGPSQTIDTACSSSLTALHNAVRAIQAGDCDQAITGGVHLLLTEGLYVALGQLGMMSPDGRCMTFDRRANGFVRGEGVGALLLKPLSRALADRDTVHAVVLGSGISHGGHVQSLTIPNPAAQADLIAAVYRRAGVDPRTISYVEAHGTGTVVGDPIEVRGLRKAFADVTGVAEDEAVTAWCGLGTIKSNMGHLEAAAGLAGVLKTVLAMRCRTLPASIHCADLNPLLEIEHSPFYVVDRTREWTPVTGRRRAAVSSMGFGGANAHVLLEEPATRRSDVDRAGPELVVLSARTDDRLREYVRRLVAHLGTTESDGVPAAGLRDIAYTLQVGRDSMRHRLAVLATSREELTAALTGYLAGDVSAVYRGEVDPRGPVRPAADLATPATSLADLQRWARAWVTGSALPWSRLRRADERPYRVSLPTYPFAEEPHWAYPDRPPTTGPSAVSTTTVSTTTPTTASTTSPAAAGHDEPQRWRELLTALQKGEMSVPEVDRLLSASENGNHS